MGATLQCGAQASLVAVHGLEGEQASVVTARGLSSCPSRAGERMFRVCGAWPSLLHSMWDPPIPGTEPVSPALAGDS